MSDLALRGLHAPVDVFRDDLGVAHVRASDAHDAFFAQGFVHAQDRFWQMEYDRHRAAGRLSELIGRTGLVMDAFCRRCDLEGSARGDYESSDHETQAMLDAYAAGVEAYISTGRRSVEHELLGLEPESWRPWDSGAILKVRHVLMGVFDTKLWRARLLAALGTEAAVVVGSSRGRTDTVIVPVGDRVEVPAGPDELGALATSVLAEGSNNWAVHGSRTASGLPLVAGDPHRTLEVPNVYLQNHIACPAFDAIGLSMPGVPGMFHFGHNADVAWCVTHAMADTQDLYIERFRDGMYEFKGEWRGATKRRETIHVRGDPDVEIDVTVTHHGPVLFGDPGSGTAISMRWTATDRPNTTMAAIGRMLQACTTDELDAVMALWVDPCNNLVMADRRGSIAYVHRGRVPVRSTANAWTPVPGWTGEHEWTGDVPYAALPRLRDPEEGFIATANNRVAGDGYEAYLGMDYAPANRALRLLERLWSTADATVEDMAAIHADRISLDGLALARALTGRAAELVAGWDGAMDAGAVAPLVVATVRDEAALLLCDLEPLQRVRRNPYTEEPYPYSVHTRARAAFARLYAAGDRTLTGDRTWTAILDEACARALDRLERELGPETEAWTWGSVHRTEVRHPLSREFPDARLDPAPVSAGGDRDTVQVTSSVTGLGIASGSVARYVFDLGDWDRSAWIVPLGMSGDPRSPHFQDQADDWAAVRLRPMTYSWPRIEAGAQTRQTLEPR